MERLDLRALRFTSIPNFLVRFSTGFEHIKNFAFPLSPYLLVHLRGPAALGFKECFGHHNKEPWHQVFQCFQFLTHLLLIFPKQGNKQTFLAIPT